MSIECLPDEVLDIILDVLMNSWDEREEREFDDEGNEIFEPTPYVNMRNVRLANRRFSELATRHLFRQINFSLDPVDWARAIAISKRPLLAQSVCTIVFAANYYDGMLKTEKAYAEKINSMLHVWDDDNEVTDLQPFPIEALRRGFRRYTFKARMYHHTCALENLAESSEVKILVRILKRLPNVRRLIVDRRVLEAPNTMTRILPQAYPPGLLRRASHRQYRWIKSQLDCPERSLVELLPAEKVGYTCGDLKFRALRVFDQVSKVLSSRCTRLDLILDRGLPRKDQEDRQSAIEDFPHCPVFMSSLRVLHLSIRCKLECEGVFIQNGGIAKFIRQGLCLTEISIAITYAFDFRMPGVCGPLWVSTPNCGWAVSLDQIFGEEALPLKTLFIDGLTSTLGSLTSFLSRHRKTLRVLRMSTLASYCDAGTEQEMLKDLRRSGIFQACGPPLLAIQAADLDLHELAVHEQDLYEGLHCRDSDRDLRDGPFLDVLDVHGVSGLEELRKEDHGTMAKPIRLRGMEVISQFLSTYASSVRKGLVSERPGRW